MITIHFHPRGFANECTWITAETRAELDRVRAIHADYYGPVDAARAIEPLPARDRARHRRYIYETDAGTIYQLTAAEVIADFREPRP